jgi:hypothetical protein
MTPFSGIAHNLFENSIPLGVVASLIPPSSIDQPFEQILSEPHRKHIENIDGSEIRLKPANQTLICKERNYEFPEIVFTLKEIRKYLEENFTRQFGKYVEGWIIGGAAHPACLSYNDIDLAFYIDKPDYDFIDNVLMGFLKEKLNIIKKSHPGVFPTNNDWLIRDVYFTGRKLFKDNAGSFYGLQNLQIKINEHPKFHCVSPADGAQVSPERLKLRFAMGKTFATTSEQFDEAMYYCKNKIYKVLDVKGQRDLLFRIAFKASTGHTVERQLFDIAIQQLDEQLLQEIREQQAKRFRAYKFGRVFSSDDRPILTKIDLIAEKLKNHQTNHFPDSLGKIIDFLNFMSSLNPEKQIDFALAWTKKADELNLGELKIFAELIVKCPNSVPYLLSFMRGLFFCQWAHQPEGIEGPMFAYERRLPHCAKEEESKENGSSQPQEHSMHIALKEGNHTYFLSLPEAGSPFHIVKNLLSSLPILKSLCSQHFSKGLEIFSGAFKHLKFNQDYVSATNSSFIGKLLLTAFDKPHVKKTLVKLSKGFDSLNESFKIADVLNDIKGHLKDPKDLELLAFKNATINMQQLNLHARKFNMKHLEQCSEIFLKYLSASSKAISEEDLIRLKVHLNNIFNDESLQATGLDRFFRNVCSQLSPHFITFFQKSSGRMMFERIDNFINTAIKLGIMSAQEAESFYITSLEQLTNLPPSKERQEIDRRGQVMISCLNKLSNSISFDPNLFLLHIEKFIESNNPKFWLYFLRNLTSIFGNKKISKDAVSVIKNLLEKSLNFELPELDKACFQIIGRLIQSDIELFNMLVSQYGIKIFEDFTNASQRLYIGNKWRDAPVFEVMLALKSTLDNLEEQLQSNYLESLFNCRPSIMNLQQLETFTKIAILVLQKSAKAHTNTLTQSLKHLVLPLLGITRSKITVIEEVHTKYHNMGLQLLQQLVRLDKDSSWLLTIQKELFLRLIAALAKQNGSSRAEEHFHAFGMAIVYFNKEVNLLAPKQMEQFHMLLQGNFENRQQLSKMLFQIIQEFNSEWLDLISFQKFKELNSSLKTEILEVLADPKLSGTVKIEIDEYDRSSDFLNTILVAEELFKTVSKNKTYRILKSNQLAKYIIRSLQYGPDRLKLLSKEQLICLNKVLAKAINILSVVPKSEAVYLAKELLNQSMKVRLLNSLQRKDGIMDLMHGFIVLANLNPEHDYGKEIVTLLEKSIKNSESSLKEGLNSVEVIKLLAPIKYIRVFSQEASALFLNVFQALFRKPPSGQQTCQMIMLTALSIVQKLLKQNVMEATGIALKFLQEAAKSNPDMKEPIKTEWEKCLSSLSHNVFSLNCRNDSCDNLLDELLNTLAEKGILSLLQKDLAASLTKGMIRTDRKKIRDWSLKMIPGWNKTQSEKGKAYELLFYKINEICSEDEISFDMLTSLSHLIDDHLYNASACIELKNKKIIYDCYIAVYSRLKDKKKLGEATLIFVNKNVSCKATSLTYLLKGFSQFPAEILKKSPNDLKNAHTYGNVIANLLNAEFLATISQDKINRLTAGLVNFVNAYINLEKTSLEDRLDYMLINHVKAVIQAHKKIFDIEKIVTIFLKLNFALAGRKSPLEIYDLYYTLKEILCENDLKIFEKAIEAFLIEKHQEVIDCKIPLKMDDAAFIKLTSMVEMWCQLTPLYKLCSPEKAREGFERVIEIITAPRGKFREENFSSICLELVNKERFYKTVSTSPFKVVPAKAKDQNLMDEQYIKVNLKILSYYHTFQSVLREQIGVVKESAKEIFELIIKSKHFSYLKNIQNSLYSVTLSCMGEMLAKGNPKNLKDFFSNIEKKLLEQIQNGNKEIIKDFLPVFQHLSNELCLLSIVLRSLAETDKNLKGTQISNLKRIKEQPSALLGTLPIMKQEPFSLISSSFEGVSFEFRMLSVNIQLLLDAIQSQAEWDCAISDKTFEQCCELSVQYFEKYCFYFFQSRSAPFDIRFFQIIKSSIKLVFSDVIFKKKWEPKLNVLEKMINEKGQKKEVQETKDPAHSSSKKKKKGRKKA